MKVIKATRKNLSDLLSWSSEKRNAYEKKQIVENIIFRVERAKDCQAEYRSGFYSEVPSSGQHSGRWISEQYTLKIEKGIATLSNGTIDKIATETILLEKPMINKYYIPASTVYFEGLSRILPEGEYPVIGQDVNMYHVLYEGNERGADKKRCTVIK